jgi:hypothetical protein
VAARHEVAGHRRDHHCQTDHGQRAGRVPVRGVSNQDRDADSVAYQMSPYLLDRQLGERRPEHRAQNSTANAGRRRHELITAAIPPPQRLRQAIPDHDVG